MTCCTVLQVEQPPLVQPAVAEQVVLRGLKVQLGPDLRASYPVVMNFTIGGEVVLNGPAQMEAMQLAGVVKLDTGEVGCCWLRSFTVAPDMNESQSVHGLSCSASCCRSILLRHS